MVTCLSANQLKTPAKGEPQPYEDCQAKSIQEFG